jgi:hypothetical protein
MHDILHIAVAKLLEKQIKARNIDVPVGTVTVDETVTIHVKATVKRLADQEYTPTISIPLKATVALLLAKMGFQRDRAADLLVEAMTEALNDDVLGSEAIAARLADVDTAMERVTAITAALPKDKRKGATSVVGTIETVEDVPEPASIPVEASVTF